MDADGNSEAQIGWGITFMLADPDTDVLTELDEVTEVPFAEEMADDVEVTHMKSPGRRKEYIQGLIEPGDGTITLNYIPGSPTDVLVTKARESGKTLAYQTIIPDKAGDPKWQVDGFLYVKSRARATPIGDRMTQTVNVKFTGATDEGAPTVTP